MLKNREKSRQNPSFNRQLNPYHSLPKPQKKFRLRVSILRGVKNAPKNRWKRLFDLVALSTWSPRSAAQVTGLTPHQSIA